MTNIEAIEEQQFSTVYNHLAKLFGSPKTSLAHKITFDASRVGNYSSKRKARTAEIFKGKFGNWLVGSADSHTVRTLLNFTDSNINFIPLGAFIKCNTLENTPLQSSSVPTVRAAKGLQYLNSFISISYAAQQLQTTTNFYQRKFSLTTDKQLLNLGAMLTACNTYTIAYRTLLNTVTNQEIDLPLNGTSCLYSIGTFVQGKLLLQTTTLRNNTQEATKYVLTESNSTADVSEDLNSTTTNTFVGQNLLKSNTQVVVLCEGVNDCIAGNLLVNSLNNPFIVFLTIGGTNHKIQQSGFDLIKSISPNAKIVTLFDHDDDGLKASKYYHTNFGTPVRLWSSLVLPFGLTPVLTKGFDISDFYKYLNTSCTNLDLNQKQAICTAFKSFVVNGK